MFTVQGFRGEVARLDRHVLLASRDPRDVRSGVSTLLCDHELECASRCDATVSRLAIGDMNLIKLRYGSDVLVRPTPASGFVMLQFVLSGQIEIEHGQYLTTGKAGEAIIIESLDQRALRWSADCEQLIVPIPRVAFTRAVEGLTGRASPSTYGFDHSFKLNTAAGQSLMTLAGYLLSLPRTPGAGDMAIGALTADLLAHHLLLHHRAERADVVATAIPYYLKRAEDYARDNLAAEIDLDRLAAHAGVSARTLSEAFRRFRGTSPMQWLRVHRLEQVRAWLLVGDAVTVASAAARAGFTHAGRFSQLYRERYGESPNQTLAEARRG